MDRFDASLDGKLVHGANVPLSLALTGLTVERTVPKGGAKAAIAASETGDDPRTDAECCIECGDWIVCCEPSAGWCCGLECSSGGSCTACTAEQ